MVWYFRFCGWRIFGTQEDKTCVATSASAILKIFRRKITRFMAQFFKWTRHDKLLRFCWWVVFALLNSWFSFLWKMENSNPKIIFICFPSFFHDFLPTRLGNKHVMRCFFCWLKCAKSFSFAIRYLHFSFIF